MSTEQEYAAGCGYRRTLTRDELVQRLIYLEGELDLEQNEAYAERFVNPGCYELHVELNICIDNAQSSNCDIIYSHLADQIEQALQGLKGLEQESAEKISYWHLDHNTFKV